MINYNFPIKLNGKIRPIRKFNNKKTNNDSNNNGNKNNSSNRNNKKYHHNNNSNNNNNKSGKKNRNEFSSSHMLPKAVLFTLKLFMNISQNVMILKFRNVCVEISQRFCSCILPLHSLSLCSFQKIVESCNSFFLQKNDHLPFLFHSN